MIVVFRSRREEGMKSREDWDVRLDRYRGKAYFEYWTRAAQDKKVLYL